MMILLRGTCIVLNGTLEKDMKSKAEYMPGTGEQH